MIAVAVGMLVRNLAAGLAAVMLWALVIECVVPPAIHTFVSIDPAALPVGLAKVMLSAGGSTPAVV